MSHAPTTAAEAKPRKAEVGERSRPPCSWLGGAFALRLLHILFVQKPSERQEEALMTQRLGWVLPGLGVRPWLGQHGVSGARRMSQAIQTFSPVTWALVHGDQRLELTRFAGSRSTRGILLLWASTRGPPRGLWAWKTKKLQNQDVAFSVMGLCSLFSQETPFGLHAPSLGSFPGAGRADSAPASPGPASSGLTHTGLSLSSRPRVLPPNHHPPGSPLGRPSSSCLGESFLLSEAL